jgi:plasmid maintenance system antidote protein VapI
MYANEIIPGDVFHPAEIIRDEMEAQGIKQSDLAKASGFNKSFFSAIFSKSNRAFH